MLQTFWSWRCQVTILLVGQILVGWLLVGLVPVRAVGGISISALQVSGGSGRTNEEYVELYNASSDPVDMSGWRLAKLTKAGALGNWTYLGPAFAGGTVLPGHTFALAVHTDAAAVFGGDWQYGSSTLAEDNSVVVVNAAGEVVDLVGWGQAINFTGQPLPTAGAGRWARALLNDKSLGAFAKLDDGPRQGAATNFLTAPTSTPEGAGGATTATVTSTPTIPEVDVSSTPMTQEEPVLDLVLSEVYSQPNTGEAEFVELYNPNDAEVDVTGWYLVEGGGSVTMVTGTMAAKSFLVVAPIKGSLNNTGDEVQLWHGEVEIERVVYGEWDGNVGSPAKGQSLVRAVVEPGGEWKIGTPTPGKSNVVLLTEEIPEVEEEEEAVVKNVTGKLKINEILPDTIGADAGEFVEIINATAAEIAMIGWRLEVGEQEYFLPDQVVLPGALVVFYRDKSRLVLPNLKKEKVRLVRGDGSLSDSVGYETPTVPGAAWVNVVGRGWGWSQSSTPGLPNVWKQLNRAPYAEITGPAEAVPGEVINFTSDNVYDPDQDLLTYKWDLGDGQQSTSTGISTVYAKPGKYSITLLVTDPFGLKDEFKWSLKVLAPVVLSEKATTTPAVAKAKTTTSAATKKTTSTTKVATTKPKAASAVKTATVVPKGPALSVAARLLAENEGKFVSIKGELTSGSGKYWRLDDGTAEAVVILPATKLPSGLGWKKGTVWQVSGVVKKYKEDWAVAPTEWADLQMVSKETAKSNAATAMPVDVQTVKKLWWLIPVLAAVVGAIIFVKRRKTPDLVPLHVV